MKYYYIPLCSRDFNFENIFASESISPICFYSKRNFGFDYFYKTPRFQINEAIVLYNKMPSFEIDNSTDGFKFILAIDAKEINDLDIIAVDEDVIAYQKTIYLRKDNFKIYFFSEKEMKIVLAKSATSLPTKPLTKFYKNFDLISDNELIKFSTDNLKTLKISTKNIESEISFDRKFNFLKGFFYGLSAGLLGEKTPQEIKVRRSIQEILNSYAELKNKLQSNVKYPDSRYSKPSESSLTSYQKINKNIIDFEKSFLELFGKSSFSDEKISQLFYETYKPRFRSFEEAQTFVNFIILGDEIFGSNNGFKLKKILLGKSVNTNPIFVFEILKECIKNLSSPSYSAGQKINRDDIDDEFKDAIFKLESFVNSSFLNRTANKDVIIRHVKFDPSSNEIQVDSGFEYLKNNVDLDEFVLLSNIILKNTKRQKGEVVKEDLLKIVELVGNSVSKSSSAKESLLYQYLDNKVDIYSIEKVTTVTMKNFVAFVFNPDSLEKLENFLEVKEINNKWMSYSFWCAFNGFANISRNFLKPIFDVKDSLVQDNIEDVLLSLRLLLQGKEQIQPDEKFSYVTKEANTEEYSEKKNEKRVQEFYEEYLVKNWDISYSDFITLISNPEFSERIKLFKERHKIGKKDAKKIIESYQTFIDSPALF